MITDPLNPSSTVSSQHEHQHKARRLRGGGAARVGPVPFRLLSPLPHVPSSARANDAPRRASISTPRPSRHLIHTPHRMLTRSSPFAHRIASLARLNVSSALVRICFLRNDVSTWLTGTHHLFLRMLQGSSLSRLVCLPSSSCHLPYLPPFRFQKIFQNFLASFPFHLSIPLAASSDLVTGKHVLIPPSGLLRVLCRHHL